MVAKHGCPIKLCECKLGLIIIKPNDKYHDNYHYRDNDNYYFKGHILYTQLNFSKLWSVPHLVLVPCVLFFNKLFELEPKMNHR